MDRCDKCSNNSECEKCKLGSNYINKKCINILCSESLYKIIIIW